MCGCTLCLGLPYKNSVLKAVFNETTHCVLLHSLSSFTLYLGGFTNTFHFHQHHIYHHPDSHHKQPHCTTKHAISSNSLQGPHDINQLLSQLGLWFAYYCDKMIGQASDMGSTMR